MRALVTGGKGFTGRYMSEELRQAGYDVFGIGTQPEAGNTRYTQLDLLDREALNHYVGRLRPDVVVHLAGVAFVNHGDPTAFYKANLIGASNLLQALKASSVAPSCILLASSANVYGNASEGLIAEEAAPVPVNDYAVSKLAMEYMAKLHMNELPIVIARPFNYTGVGQEECFLIPKMVMHYKRRVPDIELGNLDIARDFNDVRSVVTAYRALLESRPLSQVVNVCSGRAVSLRDILTMLESLSGYRINVSINSKLVRSNEVRTLCGNPAKLRGLIGHWAPYDIESTLDWMYSAP